jgi:hypothetical protein
MVLRVALPRFTLLGRQWRQHVYTTEDMLEAFRKQRRAVGEEAYDVDLAKRLFRACVLFVGHIVVLQKEYLFRTISR